MPVLTPLTPFLLLPLQVLHVELGLASVPAAKAGCQHAGDCSLWGSVLVKAWSAN
jgi:hypothetical protein